MLDNDAVDLLLELFGWPDDGDHRYQAFTMLRKAQGRPVPTPDDFAAGRDR